MQDKILQQYKQYLTQAFSSVIKQTCKDQSLNVLSQMQNKDYYFKRVQELFVEIYCMEREGKIKEIMAKLIQMEKQSNNNIRQKQQVQQNINQYTIIHCKACIQRAIQQQEQQKNRQQNENPTSEQSFNLLILQNKTLTHQLKQTSLKSTEQLKSLTQASQKIQQKLQNKIDQLMKIINTKQKQYIEVNQYYRKQVQNVENLMRKNQEQREKCAKLEKQIKENSRNMKKCIEQKDILEENVENGRKYQIVLEEKIKRLEDINNQYRNKLDAYENQVQNMRQTTQQSKQKISSTPLHNSHSHTHTNNTHNTNTNHNTASYQISQLLTTLTHKQYQLKSETQQKLNLLTTAHQLKQQYSAYRLQKQKIINQLKQNINKVKFQYEGELEKCRKNQKELCVQLKKYQNIGVVSGDNRGNGYGNVERDTQQSKDKLRQIEIQRKKLQNKCMKLEHTNKVFLQNYQQIAQAFKQQKSLYQKKIDEFEKYQNNFIRTQKQLNKKISVRQSQYNELQAKLKYKLKFCQQKIQSLAKQIQEGRRIQKKLTNNIHKLQKQDHRYNSPEHYQQSTLKQHQLTLQINNLRTVLQQSKSHSKHELQKKQQKIKQINHIIQQKCQKIIEIQSKLQRQTTQRLNNQKLVKQLGKCLKQEQDRVIDLQQKNRKQVLQTMKEYEKKIEQINQNYLMKEQLSSAQTINYYPKSQKYQQFLNSQQQSYKKYQSLQQQFLTIKTKNTRLTQSLKQQQNISNELSSKLHQNTQQLIQLNSKLSNINNILQEQKNKNVTIIKYYQQKIGNFRNVFKQFKYQLCKQFLQSISIIKQNLIQLKKEHTKKYDQYIRQLATNRFQLQQSIILHKNTITHKISAQNCLKSQQNSTKLQKQKQQLIYLYQSKIKQKHIQYMTIIAQKQFIIQEIKENQSQAMKKYKEIQSNYKKIIGKIQKYQRNQQEMKEIVNKMQEKVDDAQKKLMIKQKQLIFYQKIAKQQQDKINKMQTQHRTQLKQIKQKYKQQNQKLFNRYQKQFNKIVSLNSTTNLNNTKKSKDKINLISNSITNTISASNLGSNYRGGVGGLDVPTKGNQYSYGGNKDKNNRDNRDKDKDRDRDRDRDRNDDDDRVQKLKREIQDQKRKVQQMERPQRGYNYTSNRQN